MTAPIVPDIDHSLDTFFQSLSNTEQALAAIKSNQTIIDNLFTRLEASQALGEVECRRLTRELEARLTQQEAWTQEFVTLFQQTEAAASPIIQGSSAPARH